MDDVHKNLRNDPRAEQRAQAQAAEQARRQALSQDQQDRERGDRILRNAMQMAEAFLEGRAEIVISYEESQDGTLPPTQVIRLRKDPRGDGDMPAESVIGS